MPRVLLYDNLKSTARERRGDAIRFHPSLLALVGNIASNRDRSRWRAATRWAGSSRASAMSAWRSSPRHVTDIDDLNAQADTWCRVWRPTGNVQANRTTDFDAQRSPDAYITSLLAWDQAGALAGCGTRKRHAKGLLLGSRRYLQYGVYTVGSHPTLILHDHDLDLGKPVPLADGRDSCASKRLCYWPTSA